MLCFINSKGLQGVSYHCIGMSILPEFSEAPWEFRRGSYYGSPGFGGFPKSTATEACQKTHPCSFFFFARSSTEGTLGT